MQTEFRWSGRFLAVAFLLAAVALPAAAVDPDADVILVRKDCTGIANCFTTLQGALGWTWNTRVPDADSRLLIDLGPGKWYDQFYCEGGVLTAPPGAGYVTLRGAGRDASLILGHGGNPSGGEGGLLSAAEIHNCTDLEFIDVGFESLDFTVYWSGPGTSTWTDVDIVNPGTGGIGSVGWYEDLCNASGQKGLHYFFGSRIKVSGRKRAFGLVPATAYWSKCSESWFYGGEIHWEMNETSANEGAAVFLNANSDFRAFGTAIRVTVPDGVIAVGPLTGVSVSDKGGFGGAPDGLPAIFHMHGGIISVNSNSGSYADAYGIRVDGANALAHTPATAYAVNSSYSVTRAETTNGGKFDAPFVWTTGSTPPKATGETGGLASVNGQDMFVETDCGADGNCAGGGSETHLMIYNASCSPTPWFDTATGACRSLTSP